MCGPVGFLADPVGVVVGLYEALGLLGRHLDEADDGRAGFLPVVTTIGPDIGAAPAQAGEVQVAELSEAVPWCEEPEQPLAGRP